MVPRVMQAGKELSYDFLKKKSNSWSIAECWKDFRGSDTCVILSRSSSGPDSMWAEWTVAEGVVKARVNWGQNWKEGTPCLSTQPSSLLHPTVLSSPQSEPPGLMLRDSKDLHFICTTLAVPQPRARPSKYLMMK